MNETFFSTLCPSEHESEHSKSFDEKSEDSFKYLHHRKNQLRFMIEDTELLEPMHSDEDDEFNRSKDILDDEY